MAETLPVVNGSSGTWGGILNTAIGNLDTKLQTATDKNTTQDADITNIKGRVTTLETSGGVSASTVTTKGDLLVATGASSITRQGVGSNNYALIGDSSQSTGVRWSLNAGSIMCRVRASSTQNVAASGLTTIVFQNSDNDRLGNFTLGSGTFTASVAGWYEFTGGVGFQSNGTANTYRQVYWNVSGSPGLASGASALAPQAVDFVLVARPYPVLMAVGDTVNMVVSQNSGSAVTTSISVQYQSGMSVKYLGV